MELGLNEPALRLFVQGGACALFLLLAVLLWRDARASPVARLSAALSTGAAAGAVTSAPGFHAGGSAWHAPVLALSWATPAVFWLWARAGFGEQFRFRVWHAGPCAVMSAAGLVGTYQGGVALAAAAVLALMFGLLAVGETLIGWRIDLVARRRRLRAFVVAVVVVILAGSAFANLTSGRARRPGSDVAGLATLVLAGVASASLLRISRPDAASALLTHASSPALQAAPAPAVDPALLQVLAHLMTVERAYRAESVTIGALAARLGMPEHRLRHAINQGLGHRNFNSFVNHYRIEDAKAALVDPAQRAVPILTIAMDAGFQSLGPFNRAFKADTGKTPTEYRRAALAE